MPWIPGDASKGWSCLAQSSFSQTRGLLPCMALGEPEMLCIDLFPYSPGGGKMQAGMSLVSTPFEGDIGSALGSL